MELTHTASFSITAALDDGSGCCRPSDLLRFSCDAAEGHCRVLGVDRLAMEAKNYFWVIIRQKIEITRLPRVGETVTVKTWPMPATRVAYPRAAEGFDSQGNRLFRLIGLWVIMDISSRAMVLPGASGVDVPGTLFGTELKAPGGLAALEEGAEVLRTVKPEDLDANNHMNNARYLDWAMELLPEKAGALKEASLCYMKEALLGQRLGLRLREGPECQVYGFLEDTDVAGGQTRIFSAKLCF